MGRSRALPTSTVSLVTRREGISQVPLDGSEKSGSRRLIRSALLSVLPGPVRGRLRADRFMADVHRLLREGLGQIGVDGGGREPKGLGILIGVGVTHPGDPGHPHRRHAHGAGLAAGIDLAAGEVGCSERLAGGAKGIQLGMRGRVVRGQDLVDATGDDNTVSNDHSTEWSSSPANVVLGKLECFCKVVVSGVRHLHPAQTAASVIL